MRNSLVLLILVFIGLTTPALADRQSREQRNKADYKRVERVESDQRAYAGHERRDEKYGRFQARMKNLRKDLRHERRNKRHIRRVAKHYSHRQTYYAPLVIAPRPAWKRRFSPSLLIRIPLNW